MKALLVLLPLFFIHTASLWNPGEKLAGGYGDPLAHAGIPEWYCSMIPQWQTRTDRFMAPFGVNMANSYDSPFPLILTCPFSGLGTIGQFHLFAALQVLLILLSSWMVARVLFREESWRIAYVLFAWWTGFYIGRVQEHYTLLSGLWGFQFLLWIALAVDVRRARDVLLAGLLLGLTFSGSFHNIAMLGMPALLLVGYVFWTQRARLKSLAVARNISGALVIFVAVFGYLFGPFVEGYFTQDLRRLPGDRGFYSLDLLSPFVAHPLNWMHALTGRWARIPSEALNSFDLVVLVAAVWALTRKSFWSGRLERVLFAVAALSLIAALGPVIRFNQTELFANPLDAILAQLPPFSFSRTPGRFAAVTGLCLTYFALTFLHRRFLPLGWKVPAALCAWVLIMGPAMNREILLPTLEYRRIFPMTGIEAIRQAPAEFIVAHIPAAYAQDPQNFLQIFHEKKITSGYLSYATYTDETLIPHANDPFLSQLGCNQTVLPFRNGELMRAPYALRAHAVSKNLRVWILNKRILSDPNCADLLAWLRQIVKQPWMKLIEENENYAILAVQ